MNWYRKPLSAGDFRPVLEDCAWMLREGDFGPYGSRIDDEIPCGVVLGGIARNNVFTWESPAMTHGQIYRLIVRSYADDGTLSDSTARVDVTADAVGPLVSVTPTAVWTEYNAPAGPDQDRQSNRTGRDIALCSGGSASSAGIRDHENGLL
jgi:hypothetical protein